MQVARENGIFIPSLCYFEDIEPPLGTCRVCTCKIDGAPGPACTESVRDGFAARCSAGGLGIATGSLVVLLEDLLAVLDFAFEGALVLLEEAEPVEALVDLLAGFLAAR